MNSDVPHGEKDSVLASLASDCNIAQFVSFSSATGEQRHSCVRSFQPNHPFASRRLAISELFDCALDRSVNVRTFREGDSKGGPFLYGISSPDEAIAQVESLLSMGWNVIVNETIDVSDGGVSGVIFGDAIEFAPGDTPRCVDEPDCCRLPRELGLSLLNIVYGFTPELPPASRHSRLEFSIHPVCRGFKRTHTIIWEIEPQLSSPSAPVIRWPNRFSRFLGDKVFGLLIGHLLGLSVPATTAISRKVAPFTWGTATGEDEIWIRSAPDRQDPGKYSTHRGWTDLFEIIISDETLSQSVDTSNSPQTRVMTYLLQHGVKAVYSGAAAVTASDDVIVEGVKGFGVDFMLGQAPRESPPVHVIKRIQETAIIATKVLGPVRLEWAFDGDRVWVLQLHVGCVSGQPDVIVEGSPSQWVEFDVRLGLPALKTELNNLSSGIGYILVGDIGVTSHFGDLLRSRRIPSRIDRWKKLA